MPKLTAKRKPTTGLWNGQVTERTYFGTVTRKGSRAEFAEAYRLVSKHRDLWLAKP